MSPNSRAFLKNALEIRYRKKGKPNFSDFSRRAGFSSRSFLSEYLSGKKGLSIDALSKIKLALKLPKDCGRLFELLVFYDQEETCPRRYTKEEVVHRTAELRKALSRRKYGSGDLRNVVQQPILFQVFAASGSPEIGATLKEIVDRTQLSQAQVFEALQQLIEQDFVRKDSERYITQNNWADFLGLTSADGLVTMADCVCTQIKRNLETIINNDANTILYSAFSMNKVKMQMFKQDLRDRVFDLIDKYQEESGDNVVQLFLCAHGPLLQALR